MRLFPRRDGWQGVSPELCTGNGELWSLARRREPRQELTAASWPKDAKSKRASVRKQEHTLRGEGAVTDPTKAIQTSVRETGWGDSCSIPESRLGRVEPQGCALEGM